MKTTQFLFILSLFTFLIQLPRYSNAFLWNRQNIDALFANDDEIFNDLATDWPPEEVACLDQFRLMVNQLKTTQGWALDCKYPQGFNIVVSFRRTMQDHKLI